jgi:uncharacterized OsmC-like protein
MDKIKSAFERNVKALNEKPSLGRSTGSSKIRVRSGLVCDIEEGRWRLTADMPEGAGGTAAAPTPGVYGRAALGSCLAMGYTMYAAKLGVPIESLEIELYADYDDGALFGVGDAVPGYTEVRYVVTIETSAPEADVLRVLDEGDAHSPYLDVFRRAQKCTRAIRLKAPGAR